MLHWDQNSVLKVIKQIQGTGHCFQETTGATRQPEHPIHHQPFEVLIMQTWLEHMFLMTCMQNYTQMEHLPSCRHRLLLEVSNNHGLYLEV